MIVPTTSSVSKTVDSSLYTGELFEQENRNLQQKPHSCIRRRALGNLHCNSVQALRTNDSEFRFKLPVQRQPSGLGSKSNKLDTETGSNACTTQVSRRNERERNRVRLLNMGFERLRAVVPSHSGEQLSKISTLKKAIWYIEHLDRVLHGQNEPPRSIPYPAITTIPSTVAVAQDSKTFPSTCDNGGTTRIGVAGVGTGATSWSSPANTPGFHTIRGGRPVQHASSPIFPSRWDIGCANNIIASTPKCTHRASGTSGTAVKRPHDSGYLSVDITSQTAYDLQSCSLTPSSMMIQHQHPGFIGNTPNLGSQYSKALYQGPGYPM
ncbi:unnamed protein product [Dicrocoelium dendriticum]|nr:unnamed protein product [Dicrocoelium dendriticum]